MILFIDEADAFLRNRKSQEMSEYMRHTVNSFLYRTGTPSEKVVVVLATNSPE
jgi:ATPase family AAA domain-containing protein 3A/B